jgi:hypothetical protein
MSQHRERGSAPGAVCQYRERCVRTESGVSAPGAVATGSSDDSQRTAIDDDQPFGLPLDPVATALGSDTLAAGFQIAYAGALLTSRLKD